MDIGNKLVDSIQYLIVLYGKLGKYTGWPKWVKIAAMILFPVTIIYFLFYLVVGIIGAITVFIIAIFGFAFVYSKPLFNKMGNIVTSLLLKIFPNQGP